MMQYSKLSRIMPWFICFLGAMFYSYEYLLRIAPSVMTDDLSRFFKIHSFELGNLSAFYYYSYTPMQLFVGVLMDRYGPRLLLTMATVSCVIGSILFASTHHFGVAAVARLLIGFGSAFAFVGVLKLATLWLPKKYFGMFSGLATALGMIGAIVGDLTLTKLVEYIGWQETLYLSGFLGIAIALLIGFFVKDHGIETDEAQKDHLETLDAAISGLVKMIKNPQMWLVGIIGCGLYLPVSAFAEFWGISFLKQSYHFSPEESAFAVTMIFWGWVFGGPICGWISDTLKRRTAPIAILSFIAAIIISVILYGPEVNIFFTCLLLFIFGIATSIEVITFAIGRELNPLPYAATACAFVNFEVMIGGMVFQPMIGKLLDFIWDGTFENGLQKLNLHDYQIALSVLPIGLIICGVLALFFLRETHCEQV